MSDDDFKDDQVDFDDIPDDGGFEDFEGGGTTLGDMWRNNPLVKIGVIAGGLITIIGAIILFGGKKDATLYSQMTGGQSVNAPPGTGEVSDAYRSAVEEKNVQNEEEARRTGGSAIPTPIDSPVNRLNLPKEEAKTEDPLERWRRIQEERQRQTNIKKKEAPVVDPYADAIEALAQAMSTQMEGILEGKKPLGPIHKIVTEADFLEQKRKKEADERKAAQEQAAAQNQQTQIVNILVPAGTIEYAQLITEANSDVKGPILAHLVSGPLAGSKLLGSFKREDEYLVMSFNTIIIDGIAHSTNAVALDPDTTLTGMATDVDHKYFTRVILPAAAKFVEGMGSAIAQTGSTTSQGTNSTTTATPAPDTKQELFKGVEEASKKVSEILDDNSQNVEILVRVKAGTPMGLLFVEPVTDDTQ